MNKLLTILILLLTTFSAFAQKDDFAGFYAGKNGEEQIFAEVFRAHDSTYRLRLYSKIIEENSEILLEISNLKAKDNCIEAKDKNNALSILPTEINGVFNGNTTRLIRINYESESLAMKPVEGAKALFVEDKDLAENWSMGKKELNWIVKNKVATIDSKNSSSIITKDSFGALRMHLEFKTPPVYDEEKQQKRGNSGIKFGPYEVQILDSFGTKDLNYYDLASIYSLFAPSVNAALEPDAWQSFDIEFRPVRYGDKGEIISLPRLTVYLNGVLVQNNVEVNSPTNAKEKKKTNFVHPEKVQIQLQNHKHDVSFRNIWLLELEDGE